jgi:hypothetical protein
MSRWISWVRPPTEPRSRRLRVCVARGSMAYSAVTHPRPEPSRQSGTEAWTEAVQSTRVCPAWTRQDPFGVGRHTALESHGPQLAAAAACPWLAHGFASRMRLTMSVVERPSTKGMRTSRPPAASTVSRPTTAGAVVAALDEGVGHERGDELGGRVLVEDRHGIHAGQPGQDERAILLIQNGTTGALEAAHRRIAVHADDQAVAQCACRVQVCDVSPVQDVEAAVGEHHGLRTRPAEPADESGSVDDLPRGVADAAHRVRRVRAAVVMAPPHAGCRGATRNGHPAAPRQRHPRRDCGPGAGR